ncbi:hypothetical protein ACLB2K_058093 [Fragaria x ananassa]
MAMKLTMIARVTDGLVLAEGLENIKDSDVFYKQAKDLFNNLSRGQNEPSRMSLETGPNTFHYIIEGRVCYLTMCNSAYPSKFAFRYLEELKNEFEPVNGDGIHKAARPYAFLNFDKFIQKTKKLYQDTRTLHNISMLNDEVSQVYQIMKRNVLEVLVIGDNMDKLSEKTNCLVSETRAYAKKGRDLNRQALLREWAPAAVIVLGVVFLLFWLQTKIY